eukprot:TRINITY_DN8784_c0_g1_i13.p1 TRINITY_DN8784_c0_g1~~TRINITY_DN8784_c0_g1_i13.p1  ORF type:complete len:328 (+),score=63.16 TRINITY_DN8784_c0_g1_i13:276-1259(+)
MLTKRIIWREEVHADTILETFPSHPHYEKLLAYWPGSQYWTDPPKTKDGSLVLIQALGNCDPSVIDHFGMETLIQFHIWSMENLERLWWKTVEEKGYWPGFVAFEDLGGVGFATFSQQVIKIIHEIIIINQNYYPDMLRKAFIINVPSIFHMFWKGISMWMEPRTLAKLELIGTDLSLTGIQEHIDMSLLPPRLGGTSQRDIGPGGPLGPVPLKLKNKVASWTIVPRASSFLVVHHYEVGDVAHWEFKTKGYDIGMAVYYVGKTKEGPQNLSIVPLQRYESFKKVITNSFCVEFSGFYQFFWDNTYSWTRGKELKFNIYNGMELLSS